MRKHISDAQIRAVWHDYSKNTDEAAEELGITRVTLWRRAKALGLPRRQNESQKKIPKSSEPLFASLWQANVASADIALVFGCGPRTPSATARRLGLEPRVSPNKRKPISLHAFVTTRAHRPGDA